MALIIRSIFAVFWLTATWFIGYLAYIIIQTERNPQTIWAWFVLCAFTFISATWLAYNIIFARHSSARQ
jgi:ABC-type multidrug transport system permease subunit